MIHTVIWTALAGFWFYTLNFIATHTWRHGQKTFYYWLLLAALTILPAVLSSIIACRKRPLLPPSTQPNRLMVFLFVIGMTLWLSFNVVRLGNTFMDEWRAPRNQTWAIDIALNTYIAGTHLLEGKNPYANKAQIAGRLKPSKDVTIVSGQTWIKGVPYAYGYPYFPAMLLSYLPFRYLHDGVLSVSLASSAWLLLGLIGIAWLLVRELGYRKETLAAITLAWALCTSADSLGREYFKLAITDPVIGVWGVIALACVAFAGALIRSSLPLDMPPRKRIGV